jgi:hypothetical protein
MTQDRKYLGMTVKQRGILAGLAVLACLLFGVTGGFALRRGLGLFSRSPQPTPVIQPTSTRIIIPTATFTETLTPIPYKQLIPYGWTQYKTQLIELWTPPEFKNAAPGVVAGVAGDSVFLNLALVSSSNKSGYPPSVSVSYEPLTTATLEEFLDVKLSNIPLDVNRVENRNVSINSVEAVRLMFESKSETGLNINDLLYVFQDGGTVWYVKYSAEITDFYELLPYFEESVKTFRIPR